MSLPSGEKTVAYNTTLTGSGGNTPYAWSQSGLPAGLTLNSSTGAITGTPTGTPGTAPVSITMTEATGTLVSSTLSLAVGAAPSITTATPLPAGDVTVAYNTTVTGSGGTLPYTWSAPALTALGLAIDPATGAITGTPNSTGTTAVSVTLTDAAGAAVSKSLTLPRNAMPTISSGPTLAAGEKTAPYTATLAGTLGTAPYTWAVTTGTLPAALTLSSAGVIMGTPTATGTSTFTVTLTDTAGAAVAKSMSITIGAQPTMVVTLSNAAAGGTAGKLDKGDKITIVYSAQMSVASFCSTWSGDTTNQTLSASGVLVNVSNGTTDAMTVTGGACTFNFGTLDLGSNAYVSAAAVFGGSTVNTSIAWTWSTRTLVITLGTLKSGTVSPSVVSSSTPSYSGTTVTDPQGAAPAPYTFSAGKQF